jgi:drug/metabolite transporter (DMT)-like permease
VREGLEGGALAGNIAALLSSLGFALFTVTLRWRRLDDTLPVVLLGSLFSIVAGTLLAAQIGQPLAVPIPDALWSMLMGAVTLSGGMILYTLGAKVVPSAELALLSNTEVMLAPFWVWLLLGETASTGTFLGGAILLVAMVYNGLSGVRRLAQA